MTYFSNFDYINYDFTIKTDASPIIETLVDVLQRIQLKISKEDLDTLCESYLVTSGVKPEQIASNIYNDPFLHWTILYVNNITNVYSEWPMNEKALSEFVTKKYGAGNEYGTHHHEKMPEKIWIDPTFALQTYGESAVLVTNYEHEYELNELKRHIKVIKPDYITSFVAAFEKAKA